MLSIGAHEVQRDDERFSRFELISWWDQARLRKAKVMVIGAGALGNEIIKNCALAGFGNILVADMDRIENSNLSRSVLFRASDNGGFKAEVAARSARAIYPELNVQPFIGNIVHDLGWGAYFWADIVMGGLDNREARVAINQGAAFARKAWIDGAIEVLDGVARVFNPATGPCYECTMSQTDWKILESRRSCALLTRTEMEAGRVPTTPTTASIIAAIQVQEAIKLAHGMDAMEGQGWVYSGISTESYALRYPRKPECYGHDSFQVIRPLGCGVEQMRVGALLERVRSDLGSNAVVDLARDILVNFRCTNCSITEDVFSSLGKVTEEQAKCPVCGRLRAPETLHTLGLDEHLHDKRLSELGVPPFDVVTARNENQSVSYLFDGDAERFLGPLDR